MEYVVPDATKPERVNMAYRKLRAGNTLTAVKGFFVDYWDPTRNDLFRAYSNYVGTVNQTTG